MAQVDPFVDSYLETVRALEDHEDRIVTLETIDRPLSGSSPGQFWSLSGNAGTNPASNYCGTADDVNFVIRRNGVVAVTFETTAIKIASGHKVYPEDANSQTLGDASHTWDLYTEVVAFKGATTDNYISFPAPLAQALYFVDENGVEYQEFVTTVGALAVVFNQGEADIDFRVGASGMAKALSLDGATGIVTFEGGIVLDDQAGDTPLINFITGSNDSITFQATDGGGAGTGDLILTLADAAGGSKFQIEKSTSSVLFYVDSNADGAIIGNFYLGAHLYHYGDANTFLYFESDKITLQAGGYKFITMVEAGAGASSVTINEDSEDLNFTVKSSGHADALLVDGGTGQVTLGELNNGYVYSTAGALSEVSAIPLTDIASPTRGYIIRGEAGPVWAAYDASTTGAVLIGDGTDVVSTTTPTLPGKWTWTLAGGALEIDVASGDPCIIFDTQGADKFTLGVDDSDGDMFKVSIGGSLTTASPLSISSGAYVGLYLSGATTPARRLEVVDNGNPQMRLSQSQAVDYADFKVDASGYLTIAVSGGYLGIGPSLFTPSYDLHIYDGSGAANVLVETDNSGSPAWFRADSMDDHAGLLLIRNGSTKWIVYNDGDSSDQFHVATAIGSELFTILSSGDYGFNTTAPDSGYVHLHNKDLKISRDTGGPVLQFEDDSTGNTYTFTFHRSNNVLYLRPTGGAYAFGIDSSGYVGVGLNPTGIDSGLHVQNSQATTLAYGSYYTNVFAQHLNSDGGPSPNTYSHFVIEGQVEIRTSTGASIRRAGVHGTLVNSTGASWYAAGGLGVQSDQDGDVITGVWGVAQAGYSGYTLFAGYFTGNVRIDDAYLHMDEITAPSAPSSNEVLIYAADNGGKTTLYALFSSGAAQVIAAQP